jgi:Phage integrase family
VVAGSNPVQRADGRWQVHIRHTDEDGSSRRHTVYGNSAKEARDKAAEVRTRLRTNLPAKDRRITLGEFTAEWIDSSLEASDRKATTKTLYDTMARTHIIGAKIGTKPLDKLRPSHIDAWTVELKGRGLAESVDGELVVTETKTAKSRRVVRLSPTAERLLRDVRTRQVAERLRAGSMWQPSPYVFTTELGEPCDPRNALRALKAAAKRATLPSTVGLHTLRHSAASVMLSAGVPLKVVSEVFGHASVAITGDVYGHVSPDVSREALTRLSDALA